MNVEYSPEDRLRHRNSFFSDLVDELGAFRALHWLYTSVVPLVSLFPEIDTEVGVQ